MINGPPTSAIVPVKSAWYSKINWAAAVMLVVSILGIFNINVPEETSKAVIFILTQVTGVIVPLVIMVMRTKYTASVTASAVSNAPTVVNQQVPVQAVTPAGPVALAA